ncbi:MAG: WYL domain-containing protein [Bacteroidales bacterium]|nr:WYL domain-containing protein [Bacteroidales bacterium]
MISRNEHSYNVKKGVEEMFFRPTFDFRQELLSMGNSVEVLSPKSLRNEMKQQLQGALALYKAK